VRNHPLKIQKSPHLRAVAVEGLTAGPNAILARTDEVIE